MADTTSTATTTASTTAKLTATATSSTTSSNVTWHDGEISRADRNNLLGQVGATLWFTGLSGSGEYVNYSHTITH